MSWSLQFSEPIVLPDGSELATLRDAHDHLSKFPKSEQEVEKWKAGAHCLIAGTAVFGAPDYAKAIADLRAATPRATPELSASTG